MSLVINKCDNLDSWLQRKTREQTSWWMELRMSQRQRQRQRQSATSMCRKGELTSVCPWRSRESEGGRRGSRRSWRCRRLVSRSVFWKPWAERVFSSIPATWRHELALSPRRRLTGQCTRTHTCVYTSNRYKGLVRFVACD